MAGFLTFMLIIILKNTNMFKRKKEDRLNLRKVFLTKQEQANRAQTANTSPDYRRFPKSLLSLLLIICTTTVAAFFVVNARDESNQPREQKVLNKKSGNTQKQIETRPAAERALATTKVTTPVSDPVEVADYPVLNPDTGSTQPGYEPISRKIEDPGITKIQYKLRPGANIYQEPDASSKSTNINRVNSEEPFNGLAEENGFVYAVLSGANGSRVEGWVLKKDIRPVKSFMNSGSIK
jgi:hypothetical protein